MTPVDASRPVSPTHFLADCATTLDRVDHDCSGTTHRIQELEESFGGYVSMFDGGTLSPESAECVAALEALKECYQKTTEQVEETQTTMTISQMFEMQLLMNDFTVKFDKLNEKNNKRLNELTLLMNSIKV